MFFALERFVLSNHGQWRDRAELFDLVGEFCLCHLVWILLPVEYSRYVSYVHEVMCCAWFPSVETWLMLPLVVLPAERE